MAGGNNLTIGSHQPAGVSSRTHTADYLGDLVTQPQETLISSTWKEGSNSTCT